MSGSIIVCVGHRFRLLPGVRKHGDFGRRKVTPYKNAGCHLSDRDAENPVKLDAFSDGLEAERLVNKDTHAVPTISEH